MTAVGAGYAEAAMHLCGAPPPPQGAPIFAKDGKEGPGAAGVPTPAVVAEPPGAASMHAVFSKHYDIIVIRSWHGPRRRRDRRRHGGPSHAKLRSGVPCCHGVRDHGGGQDGCCGGPPRLP